MLLSLQRGRESRPRRLSRRGRGLPRADRARVLPARRGSQARARARARSTPPTQGLFSADRVAALRELASSASGDEARGLRYLLQFALDGLLGAQTRAEAEESARLEATLEVELDGEPVPFRQAAVEQANEPDPDRREALRTSPGRGGRVGAHTAVEGGAGALARALSRAGLGQLRGRLRRAAPARPRRARAPDARAARRDRGGLPGSARPSARRLGTAPARRAAPLGSAALLSRRRPRRGIRRRASAPRVRGHRWPGSGSTSHAQANVHLDAEPRPTKSPRAFCAPLRVPDEVYLVIAPVGRPRRLRRTLPRGRPHRALRARRSRTRRSSTGTWATTR